MADAKKCDRCGKLYTNNTEKRVVDGFFSPVVFSSISIITINNNIVRDIDLCDNCMDDLLTFIEIKDEEKENG